MKTKIILSTLGIAVLALSCRDSYIDKITEVSQGQDNAAPVVKIISPAGNLTIPFTETSTDFNFSYEVSDDVELSKVDISVDGSLLASYENFKDYRRFVNNNIKNLPIGDHTVTITATDKSGKTTAQSANFTIVNKYTAMYPAEVMYIPFGAGNVFTDILGGVTPAVVGTPGTVGGGHEGAAFKSTTDSYITVPIAGLYGSDGISFTFWYKVNAVPDRAGILTLNDNDDDSDDNRNQGFRLLREGSSTDQTVKLNVGVGTTESWNNGGVLKVADDKWVHIGVTISKTESKIYFDGVLQNTGTYSTPFDFSTSSTLSIGSGMPSFHTWDHLSDSSLMDDLRVYNRALSEAEVKNTMN